MYSPHQTVFRCSLNRLYITVVLCSSQSAKVTHALYKPIQTAATFQMFSKGSHCSPFRSYSYAFNANLVQEPVGATSRPVDANPHLFERGDVIDLQVEGVLLASLKPGKRSNEKRISIANWVLHLCFKKRLLYLHVNN